MVDDKNSTCTQEIRTHDATITPTTLTRTTTIQSITTQNDGMNTSDTTVAAKGPLLVLNRAVTVDVSKHNVTKTATNKTKATKKVVPAKAKQTIIKNLPIVGRQRLVSAKSVLAATITVPPKKTASSIPKTKPITRKSTSSTSTSTTTTKKKPPTPRKKRVVSTATATATVTSKSRTRIRTTTTVKKPQQPIVKPKKNYDPILKLPEVQLAKHRIQNRIKQDAAREFLKLRATPTTTTGGSASTGATAGTSTGTSATSTTASKVMRRKTMTDVNKIIQMYHALGYEYITEKSIFFEAEILIKTGKKWKDSVKIINNNEYVPNDGSYDNEIHVEESHTENENTPKRVPTADGVINERNDENMDDDDDVRLTETVPPTTAEEDQQQEAVPKKRNKGGRPKGTTKDNPIRLRKYRKKAPITAENKLKFQLVTICSELFHAERVKYHSKNENVPNGTLERIVEQVEKEHNVSGLVRLYTVRSRIKRKNVSGIHKAQLPLLGDAEHVVVDYCVKLAKMGVSLDKEQLVQIADDIAKRYNLVDSILMEKKKRCMGDTDKDGNPTTNDDSTSNVLGQSWGIGFMNRNEQSIIERTGHVLRYLPRHFSLRIDHFKSMYDIVYDAMVYAGVAEKIANAALYDFDGSRLNNDTGRMFSYGLPTRYRIIKPEYFLYVDELGSRSIEAGINVFYRGNRINDPDDSGHIAGQTFEIHVDPESTIGCISPSTDATTTNTTDTMTYSVYCFQDGNGNVVTCAVVLKSDVNIQDIPIVVRWGIDTFEPLINNYNDNEEDETDIVLFQNNCGPGQAMQGGPTCNYNGIDVPCIVSTSSTGVMTSDILLEVVTSLDNLNIYDRSTTSNVKPFLLLDGHTCSLDTSFLDYVHDSEHEWIISCGLHRDSHLLRVADPGEFNSTLKENISLTKDRIVASRQHNNNDNNNNDSSSITFYASDIIPIIRQSFDVSYNDNIKLKRCLSLRGWNPMNYALMLHPILSKKGELGENK